MDSLLIFTESFPVVKNQVDFVLKLSNTITNVISQEKLIFIFGCFNQSVFGAKVKLKQGSSLIWLFL